MNPEGGADRGQVVGKAFERGYGSTLLRFRLNNSDPWGFCSVEVDEVAIVRDPAGCAASSLQQSSWVLNTSSPSAEYFVPRNDVQYIASPSAVSWEAAKRFCTANGGFVPWAETEGQ